MTTNLNLNVAGLTEQITLSAQEVSQTYRPVLTSLIKRIEPGRRTIVFLVGPPGSGKSTFAAIFQALAEQLFDREFTVLPMDGFHFPNQILQSRSIERDGQTIPLAMVKGSPESYDLEKFTESLRQLYNNQELRWPIYDRGIHDVVPDAIPVGPEGVFIVEGNYLLLNEPGWRELSKYAHRRIFISAPEDMLVGRLINRQIRGGRTEDHARAWVQRNDVANIRRTLSRRLPAEVLIEQEPNGENEIRTNTQFSAV